MPFSCCSAMETSYRNDRHLKNMSRASRLDEEIRADLNAATAGAAPAARAATGPHVVLVVVAGNEAISPTTPFCNCAMQAVVLSNLVSVCCVMPYCRTP